MQVQPSNALLKTISGRIKAAREAKSLTVTETAERIGISRVQLHAWENGTVTEMRVGPLVEFTSLTKVSLDWLIDRRGPDPDLRRPHGDD